MDEAAEINPFQVELIDDESYVYRQVHIIGLTGTKPRRTPNEAEFKPSDDGLSVYWNRHINELKEIFLIIGISYATNRNTYKDYTFYRVFKFSVGHLRSIANIQDVIGRFHRQKELTLRFLQIFWCFIWVGLLVKKKLRKSR